MFQTLFAVHKVCGLYENAVKAEPLSEDLYTHLFMSYVRVGDYKSQRRTAMALYKIAPKGPYYCWAVMSIILQVRTAFLLQDLFMYISYFFADIMA